jgi:hypothetical protein
VGDYGGNVFQVVCAAMTNSTYHVFLSMGLLAQPDTNLLRNLRIPRWAVREDVGHDLDWGLAVHHFGEPR